MNNPGPLPVDASGGTGDDQRVADGLEERIDAQPTVDQAVDNVTYVAGAVDSDGDISDWTDAGDETASADTLTDSAALADGEAVDGGEGLVDGPAAEADVADGDAVEGGDANDGGDGQVADVATGSVCDGAGTRLLLRGQARVDDFEGDSLSARWSSYADVAAPNSFKLMQVLGGAAGTRKAGRYAGTGATPTDQGGFGVGAVFNVAIDSKAGTHCLDISNFDGVTFWAKASTIGRRIALAFVLPETNARAAATPLGGGDCVAGCSNHPHTNVTLTDEWAQYAITFAEAKNGSAKVKRLIQQLLWTSPDSDWDLSLDEIQFYQGTPPTGPVNVGGADAADGFDAADAAASDVGATDVALDRPDEASNICQGLACQQTTCVGAMCMVPTCSGDAVTTLSGTVYDPAGKMPLYNATVYVPNDALTDLPEGASCNRCESPLSGNPLVMVHTDAMGFFKLLNPPVGSNIPVVIQIGKWRRRIFVPSIVGCVDNRVSDPDLTRLPRNKSEGHIPRIAVTTGGEDALECLLRKIGIDDAEFTTESGGGRVNLFNGVNGTNRFTPSVNGGALFTAAPTWWDHEVNLSKYDLVLHACDGQEVSANKSEAARQALLDYVNKGGRMFASHWSNYWLEFGPLPLPTVATFNHGRIATQIVSSIDGSFPKASALADWLVHVGASTVRGELPIRGVQHTVDAVNTAVAQRWMSYDAPKSVQYLTANTPIGSAGDKQCGRLAFSDFHSSGGAKFPSEDSSAPDLPFPTGCVTPDLSPQEKALEFMLFDLSACIVPDNQTP